MKKIIAALLCLVMILPLAACEDNREAVLAHRAAEAHREEEFQEAGGYIEWQLTPKSDCFYAVGYDEGSETLALIFRSNLDRTYVYSEFWASTYKEFMSSDSLGSYYNKNIKGQYPSKRIDDNDDTYYEPR